MSGIFYLFTEDYVNASNSLDKAIKLNPKYSVAHFYKGYTFSETGKTTDSLRCYNYCIDELGLKDPVAYETRGNLLKKLGREKEAEKDFNKAKELKDRARR